MSEQNDIILEEEIDENYEPNQEEIREYAEYLGMDLNKDQKYFYIAKEGLKVPLPGSWKPCQSSDGDIYYFNFETGESQWDHPCDTFYKEMFLNEKSKVTGITKKKEDEKVMKKIDDKKEIEQQEKEKLNKPQQQQEENIIFNEGEYDILEEEIDPNYKPNQQEIEEYALFLGMDLVEDKDLFYIAKEGLTADLPSNWRPCQNKKGVVFYLNLDTNKLSRNHPCDIIYKEKYILEKLEKKAKKSNQRNCLQQSLKGKTESEQQQEQEVLIFNEDEYEILEEEIDPSYKPNQQEIEEYAKFLGMDLVEDKNLIYIAEEGLTADLPSNWKPCQNKKGVVFYLNLNTNKLSREHPCDNVYNEKFRKEKKKLLEQQQQKFTKNTNKKSRLQQAREASEALYGGQQKDTSEKNTGKIPVQQKNQEEEEQKRDEDKNISQKEQAATKKE